jgi:hypothetical protein
MPTLPINPSESFRRRNPTLYPSSQGVKTSPNPQSDRNSAALSNVEITTNFLCHPTTDELKLNKTERAFLKYLELLNFPWIGVQNISLKIGNDCRYVCDFWAIGFDGELIGYETKGFYRPQAKVKMAVVARLFPWIKFKLVRKIKNGWDIQDVKP